LTVVESAAGWRRTAMPHETTEAVAEAVFGALADPTRRGILAILASDGPATATDLAERLPISRQAITKHLNLLTDAGLVRGVLGERRRVRYHLQPAPMEVAQSYLAMLAREWIALNNYLDDEKQVRASR
jgi:DNA-binding transcriptional ArsR family regulator